MWGDVNVIEEFDTNWKEDQYPYNSSVWERTILLRPCSEALVILPKITSPLNGRKIIRVNST
jgi:hypothetical protein